MTLSEAADKLFNIAAMPEEFFEHEDGSPLRRDIIMRQISMCAGVTLYRKFARPRSIRPIEGVAATCWRYAEIIDCNHEAQRIADAVREA